MSTDTDLSWISLKSASQRKNVDGSPKKALDADLSGSGNQLSESDALHTIRQDAYSRVKGAAVVDTSSASTTATNPAVHDMLAEPGFKIGPDNVKASGIQEGIPLISKSFIVGEAQPLEKSGKAVLVSEAQPLADSDSGKDLIIHQGRPVPDVGASVAAVVSPAPIGEASVLGSFGQPNSAESSVTRNSIVKSPSESLPDLPFPEGLKKSTIVSGAGQTFEPKSEPNSIAVLPENTLQVSDRPLNETSDKGFAVQKGLPVSQEAFSVTDAAVPALQSGPKKFSGIANPEFNQNGTKEIVQGGAKDFTQEVPRASIQSATTAVQINGGGQEVGEAKNFQDTSPVAQGIPVAKGIPVTQGFAVANEVPVAHEAPVAHELTTATTVSDKGFAVQRGLPLSQEAFAVKDAEGAALPPGPKNLSGIGSTEFNQVGTKEIVQGGAKDFTQEAPREIIPSATKAVQINGGGQEFGEAKNFPDAPIGKEGRAQADMSEPGTAQEVHQGTAVAAVQGKQIIEDTNFKDFKNDVRVEDSSPVAKGIPVAQGIPVANEVAFSHEVNKDGNSTVATVKSGEPPQTGTAVAQEARPSIRDIQMNEGKEGFASQGKQSPDLVDAASRSASTSTSTAAEATGAKKFLTTNDQPTQPIQTAEFSQLTGKRLQDSPASTSPRIPPEQTSDAALRQAQDNRDINNGARSPLSQPAEIAQVKPNQADTNSMPRISPDHNAESATTNLAEKHIQSDRLLADNTTTTRGALDTSLEPKNGSSAVSELRIAQENRSVSATPLNSVNSLETPNARVEKSDTASVLPSSRQLAELTVKNDRSVVPDLQVVDRSKKKEGDASDEPRRYPVGPGSTPSPVEAAKPVFASIPLQLKGYVARDSVDGNVVAMSTLKPSSLPGTTGSIGAVAGLGTAAVTTNLAAPLKPTLDISPHLPRPITSIASLTTNANRPTTLQPQLEPGAKAIGPITPGLAPGFGPLTSGLAPLIKTPDGKPEQRELIGVDVAVAAIIAAAAISKSRPDVASGKQTTQPGVSVVLGDTRRPEQTAIPTVKVGEPNRVMEPVKVIEPGRVIEPGKDVRDGKAELPGRTTTFTNGDKREVLGTELVISAMIAAAAIAKTRTDGRSPASQNVIPHTEHVVTVPDCTAPQKGVKLIEEFGIKPIKFAVGEDQNTAVKQPRTQQPRVIGNVGDNSLSESQPAKLNHVQHVPFIDNRDDAKRPSAVRIDLPELIITDFAVLNRDESEKPEDGLESLAKSSSASSQASAVPPVKVLTRPTCLMEKNKTLQDIAEDLYHDETIAWLIADLNAGRTKDTIIDGRRVVEFTSRQQIELPVWDDIVEFRRNRPANALTYNLITVVTESWIDRELLNSTLKFVGQTQQNRNLLTAYS